MQASADGKTFETLAKMDFRYLSTEVIGGFTGVMLGVFAQGERLRVGDGNREALATDRDARTSGISTSGTADFDWFEYQ